MAKLHFMKQNKGYIRTQYSWYSLIYFWFLKGFRLTLQMDKKLKNSFRNVERLSYLLFIISFKYVCFYFKPLNKLVQTDILKSNQKTNTKHRSYSLEKANITRLLMIWNNLYRKAIKNLLKDKIMIIKPGKALMQAAYE